MNKITSFTVDHLKLLPGLYVSRIDTMDNFTFTTYDLRVTRPNFEPVMDTCVCHTIEHLAATYFRNYYPNDDATQKPSLQWRAHCNTLYTNWLNYYVYQNTPYEW